MRRTLALPLSESDRQDLERLEVIGSPRARRQARSVLLGAQGMSTQEIARALDISGNTVRVWRHIFEQQGAAGLGTVAKGRGRKRAVPDDVVAEVVRLTLSGTEDGTPTRWTTRSLAQRLGISKDSVARIWAERGIAPWQREQPRLGHGRGFERAVVEAIAFHLDPPISVAVFSVCRFAPEDVSQDADLRPPGGPRGLLRQSQAMRSIEAALADAPEAAAVRGAPGAGSILRLLEAVGALEGNRADVHVLLLDTAADCAPVVAAWLAQRPTGRWYQHLSSSSTEWRESVSRWLQLANQEPLGQREPPPLRALAEALAQWTSRWVDGAEPFSWVANTELPARELSAPAFDVTASDVQAVSPSATTPSPEVVAETLRRAILHGELAPGEHVRQPQWAQRLGVSRTVLREAFKILAGQHLLRHDPQAGYFVAKLNAADMRQLYWLTARVEEEVLRNIRWPTRKEIEVLDQQYADHYGSFLVGDLSAAIDHWREYIFHLYSLSSETFLVKEAIRIWEMATPYRMIVYTTMLLQDPSGSEIAIARQNQISALHARDISKFIQSIIGDRLPAFDRYATHAEIMAFFRGIPKGQGVE